MLLSGLPPNCVVAGPNPIELVLASYTSEYRGFKVHCDGSSALTLVTRTTGDGAYPEGYTGELWSGYTARAGDVFDIQIAPNDSITIHPDPGPNGLVLWGLTPNCVATSSPVVELTLVAGDTTRVEFDVTCYESAAVEVSVSMTGADPL